MIIPFYFVKLFLKLPLHFPFLLYINYNYTVYTFTSISTTLQTQS